MIQRIFFIVIICWNFQFCLDKKIEIYPVSPYVNEIHDTINFSLQNIKVKYYIVNTNITDTSMLHDSITRFSLDHLDSDYHKYDTYEIWFFKSREGFDKNYISNDNDYIDSHSDDMMASFLWSKGKFYYSTFFIDGKPIKVFHDVIVE